MFFNCIIAKFVWYYFKEMFHWRRVPNSLDDFHQWWLDMRGANEYNLGLFSFAPLSWTLWKCRNKGAIEKIFPYQPIEVVFNFTSCLHRWCILLEKGDRLKLEKRLEIVDSWLRSGWGAAGVS